MPHLSSTTASQEFEPLLKSREAAALIRVHPKTLERWARQRKIAAHFYAGRWFFRKSELDTFVRAASQLNGQSAACGQEQKL